MLADQGAEVIKIEPVGGDPTRFFGPFREDDDERHFGGYFQSTNRKQAEVSAVDLKQRKAVTSLLSSDPQMPTFFVEEFPSWRHGSSWHRIRGTRQ